MTNKKKLLPIIIFLLSAIFNNSYSQTIPESAREKYVMGITLRDQAKNVSDYDLPIAKFKDAIALAPSWADAYKELGLTFELAGQFDNAISYLNKYLTFNPSAEDRRKAQDEIYIIKAKVEKEIAEKEIAKKNKIKGQWYRNDNYPRETVTSYFGYNLLIHEDGTIKLYMNKGINWTYTEEETSEIFQCTPHGAGYRCNYYRRGDSQFPDLKSEAIINVIENGTVLEVHRPFLVPSNDPYLNKYLKEGTYSQSYSTGWVIVGSVFYLCRMK
ncbi:hypothetical protein ACM55F_07665 [Flavobacterium sp. XS2P12]|uniref:hypothetical protein n=1 Tax=Flavobacterium melibiosi TaxID=3398734 RepID=UPI003A8C6213